jgi:tetrapyrrole methylase family protein/MazG family protein
MNTHAHSLAGPDAARGAARPLPERLARWCTAFDLDLGAGLQIRQFDDLDFFDATRPLLLFGCATGSDPRSAAGRLRKRYGDIHRVRYLRPGEAAPSDCTLTELEEALPRLEPEVVYVPPLDRLADVQSYNTLEYIVARLRGPGGCPWDREQTHQSLKPFMLEEAHEALEALDAGDMARFSEELGDLALQVVLHAQLAREAGHFSMDEVFASINAKLVRRHPHVFGDVQVSGAAEVLRNWDAIKRHEKGELGARASVLDGIPITLPALAYAQALGRRAARLGFDWPDVHGVLHKVYEELQELEREIAAHPPEEGPHGHPRLREELGDVLFALVNLARWLRVDAEEALRETNRRFRERFLQIEEQAVAQGRPLERMSLDELEQLWQEAKRRNG